MTLDNRKLLAEKDALLAKHWDQYLDMRNTLYEANHKHNRETYLLRQQIKGLEEEKAKLQEQLHAAQTSKYSTHTWFCFQVALKLDRVFVVIQIHQVSMND